MGIAWRAASATSCSRRLLKNGSAPTRSASARCCDEARESRLDLALVLAFRTMNLQPEARAAACASLRLGLGAGLFGLTSTAIKWRLGTSSCSSSSRLARARRRG